jgi:hypothetical protein
MMCSVKYYLIFRAWAPKVTVLKIVNHDKLKPYRNTSISYSKWIKQLERQVDNK